MDTELGQNSPSPEPDALRHGADGTLLPHVIAPTAVAAAVTRSAAAVVDLVEP